MWLIWLIVAGFFLILQCMTTGFLVFWFSIAALITMLASLFVKNVIVQIATFVISSAIILYVTRSLKENVPMQDETIKTNAHSVEDKVGKVTVDIDPSEATGQVKIDGETWSAKSYNDTFISKNTEVSIEKIEGVKVIVKPLQLENEEA
jgi:membrane protein implicated in regulation of membrane protease activity